MPVSLWLEKLRTWDEAGFRLINGSLRNGFFDLLMPFISNKWNFIIPAIALLLYILLCRPKRDRILVVSAIVVILLADETSQLLKDLFQRTRPFHPLRDTTRLVSFSFPSNHASNIFALATFLSYNYSRLGLICFPAAALVGYSRVYVGSHYPFDVLAGALWGALIGLLGAETVRRLTHMIRARYAGRSQDNNDYPVGGPNTFQ